MSARRAAAFLEKHLPRLLSHDASPPSFTMATAATTTSMFRQPICKLHSTAMRKTLRTVPLSRIQQRTFSTSSPLRESTGSAETDPRVALPQLEVPDYETEQKFRGLETDFPCLSRSPHAGPEPEYHKIVTGFEMFQYPEAFPMKYNNCLLPELNIAYETWGELNDEKSNAIVIFTGLSSSSHARSHEKNKELGWWEKFIGPGCAIDTDKYFVVCCNHIGGCYGSTGPSSINPTTGKAYGTTFPLISVDDMVRAQFLLLDHLGIDKLHAAIGSSLGGMCSIYAAAILPERVGRVASISACLQTNTTSIALRYLQRQAIMKDPNWQRGHYYGTSYPRMGMKIARELATITYRSGPEWKERFGRRLIDPNDSLSLCPTFEIESYIMHQGEAFCNKYDPNSLLYISKAMDLFDMAEGFESLEESVSRIQCPVMVLGVQSDILIPVWQQREMVNLLKATNNKAIAYYEINSIYGHDTFLLDLSSVGGAIKGHLETSLQGTGYVRKPPPIWLNK